MYHVHGSTSYPNASNPHRIGRVGNSDCKVLLKIANVEAAGQELFRRCMGLWEALAYPLGLDVGLCCKRLGLTLKLPFILSPTMTMKGLGCGTYLLALSHCSDRFALVVSVAALWLPPSLV